MMLPKRQLGSTDLLVSALGLGTVKFGRNTDVKYPQEFIVPSDMEIANLLSHARDLNINVIDTAPAYGNSEERLGKLLQQRHDWIIVDKAGENYINQQSTYDFTPQAIIQSIQQSLKRLKTDYIDLLLIHSDGNDENIIKQHEVFVTLDKAKQQGLIRHYGMSCKTVTGGLLTIEHADVAMVTCNPTYTDELMVITQAEKLQKGIIIKKALASGHLNKISDKHPVQTSFEFIFKNKGVHSIILGTINPEHLSENVNYASVCLSNRTDNQ